MNARAAWNTLALAALLGGALAGCADVKPWERGTLARPEMALEAHPGLRAQRDHVYASREASTAGASAAGGGCGCN